MIYPYNGILCSAKEKKKERTERANHMLIWNLKNKRKEQQRTLDMVY